MKATRSTKYVTLHLLASNDTCLLSPSPRGTVGIGELIEALSEPSRAKTFATRISALIKDAKVNERVRNNSWRLIPTH